MPFNYEKGVESIVYRTSNLSYIISDGEFDLPTNIHFHTNFLYIAQRCLLVVSGWFWYCCGSVDIVVVCVCVCVLLRRITLYVQSVVVVKSVQTRITSLLRRTNQK